MKKSGRLEQLTGSRWGFDFQLSEPIYRERLRSITVGSTGPKPRSLAGAELFLEAIPTSGGSLRIALESPRTGAVEAFVGSDEVLDVNVMIAYR